ncbi:hypothetical protein EON68_04980, partial [archaeon]
MDVRGLADASRHRALRTEALCKLAEQIVSSRLTLLATNVVGAHAAGGDAAAGAPPDVNPRFQMRLPPQPSLRDAITRLLAVDAYCTCCISLAVRCRARPSAAGADTFSPHTSTCGELVTPWRLLERWTCALDRPSVSTPPLGGLAGPAATRRASVASSDSPGSAEALRESYQHLAVLLRSATVMATALPAGQAVALHSSLSTWCVLASSPPGASGALPSAARMAAHGLA